MPPQVFSAWRLRRVLLLCVLCTAYPAANAATSAMSLRDAIVAALADNPDLQRFEFEFHVADAVRDQARLAPAANVAVDLENFAGSDARKGLDDAEATLTLSRVIELGGKRQARIDAADADLGRLRVARQSAQLDVLAEVTRRFITVSELQALSALAAQATDLARKTLKAAELRVHAAKAPHVEFDRATIALDQAQLEQRQTRSRLDAARRSLLAMWGAGDADDGDQALGEVRGELFTLPKLGDVDTLMARLDASPDFLRFASEQRLRDAELRLATTQRWADLTVGAGVRRLQGTGDTALVASFSVPLFAGRRAESSIAEAAGRSDAVGAERRAALVKAKAQLYALHRELQDAIDVAEVLQAAVIPKMEEALKETEYAFERGRYGYLELVDAQRAYLAVLRQRIEASARAQNLAAEIERLTNAPLAP